MKKITLLLLSLLLAAGSYAQSVGINSDGSAPDGSAMLDVKSDSKGFLAPRMASLPATGSLPDGLIVYKNDGLADEIGYYYCKNNNWIKIGDATDATQWTTSGSDIYFNSGNVGIGTATPANRFEVSGSTFNRIAASVTADVQSGFQIIRTAGGANDVNWEMYTPAGSTNLRFAKKLPADPASTDILTLQDNGNVGIGTTSPAGKLHLSTGAQWSNANYGAGLIVDGNRNNAIALLDYSSSNPWAISNSGGAFVLSQMPPFGDITTSPTTRLAISTAGYVGIGTTSPLAPLHVGSVVNGFTGHQSSTVTYFNYTNTTNLTHGTLGTINAVSLFAAGDVVTNGSFIASSDQRIKEDIQELSNSLDMIKKLKPVQYTKKDKIQNGNKLHYGFIAQEVEEVIPNAVNTGTGEIPILKPFDNVEFEEGVSYTILVKNGDDIKEMKFKTGDARPVGDIIVKSKTVNDFKSITYDMIFTVAVGAIQEQQAEIEMLKAQNANLKAENTSIKSDVEALKNVVFGTAQLKQQ